MRRLALVAAGYFLALAVVVVTSTAPAEAQTTVQQGSGNPSVTEWYTMTGARRGGETTEVCVTNAAGGSFVPGGGAHAPLTGRKAIELQNLGPNAIYCTVDGSAPLATGANGRQIAATTGVWSLDVGPSVAIRCIAAAAAQVTPACTMVTELR